MSAIIPFESGAKLPAYLADLRENPVNINADVVGTGPSFPVLSIKGKVFTLVKGDERKVMTKFDAEEGVEVPRSSLTLSVARANTKARTYYAKAWSEGEDNQAAPDCQSSDGITPDARSTNPQSTKCATCQHAVWGSRTGDLENGKGTACRQNTRLSVCDPEHPETKFLLRVPPASRKSFAEAVKQGQARNIPYNALVYRVSFDSEASSPTLVFKPTGLVSDELYAHLKDSYESDEVKEMVGLGPQVPAAPKAAPENDELDAAIAAKQAVTKAAAPAVTQSELTKAITSSEPPKPRPAVKAPKAEAPPAATGGSADLLGELDALLGHPDD